MKRIDLHPLPLRIWHWSNALLVILLIITGIQLRLSGVASLRPHDPALLVHKYAGWAMTASAVFWLVYTLVTGNLGRHFAIRRNDLRGIFRQAKFYLISIFKGEENPFQPSPEEKFNPLQKLAYGAIMLVFTPILVLTGIPFNDMNLARKYVILWNMAGILDAIHVTAGYVFVLYLIIHIYMATLGRTAASHIKAMILGYEEEPEGAEKELTEL
jgi:thiosulfate reductase cytochrome b subunit